MSISPKGVFSPKGIGTPVQQRPELKFSQYFKRWSDDSLKTLSGALTPDCTLVALSYDSAQIEIVAPYHRETLYKFKVYDYETSLEAPVSQLCWSKSYSSNHSDWRLIGT